MKKLATPDKSSPAFIGDVLFVVAMWAIFSTCIGLFVGSLKGHGGIIFLFTAWLLGAAALLVHLIVLYRRWRALSGATK